MAIKLLKKSKQRKLLEEVKQTAMGIGQDTSWKDDGKPKNRGFRTSITSTFSAVDEDDLKDLNELRSKKVHLVANLHVTWSVYSFGSLVRRYDDWSHIYIPKGFYFKYRFFLFIAPFH